MTLKRSLCGLAVALALGFCCAPVVSASDALLGTWQMSLQGQVLEMVLLAGGGGSLGGQPFTYVQGDGWITVTEANGAVETFAVGLVGDTLTLTSAQGTLVFKRVGGASMPGAAGPLGGALDSAGTPGPAGRWQGVVGDTPVIMVLRSDGSMDFAGHQGTYAFEPGRLAVNLGGQSGSYGARLAGSSLFLTGADLGGTVEFRRAGEPFAGSTAVSGGPESALAYGLYTFERDASVVVGFPRGWTASELGDANMLGVMFEERATRDSAAIISVVLPMSAAVPIQTSQELATVLLQLLQAETLPDLQVIASRPHPQAPDVTLTDITASNEGILFQGHLCSALIPAGPQANIGVFGLFFCPQQRCAAFDAEQLLTGNLAPIFGSIAKIAAASGQDGGWTPPMYDGYAYGMGGYSDEMMSPLEQQMTMQMMDTQHQAIMDGIQTMGESTYESGWYGDTYVDGNGFEYDYGGY